MTKKEAIKYYRKRWTKALEREEVLETQLDNVKLLIADHRDAFAPDHPPFDLDEFMRELEAIMEPGCSSE